MNAQTIPIQYTPGHFPVQRTITKEEGEASPQVATQTQGETPRTTNPDCGSPVSHV